MALQNLELLVVINEVFSMFKNYLEVKLDEKSKEIESKSKVDKQVNLCKCS